MRQFLLGNRKKKATSALVALAVVAATSLAYYAITGGAGSGTQKLGDSSGQALTVHLDWGDGLSPGGSSQLHVTVDNPSAGAVPVSSIKIGEPAMITSASPSCQSGPVSHGDFFVHFNSTGQNSNTNAVVPLSGVTIPAHANGYSLTTQVDGMVNFTDSGTDQSACAGQNLTIAATIP